MNTITKRAIASMYNYSNAANPRVFLSVANNGNKIGDMVFELYEDRQPAHADHFMTLCQGTNDGRGFVGQSFNKGMAGLGIMAGRLDAENNGAYGCWNPSGDLTMRHIKRGMLSSTSDNGRNGGEFMVTFGEANMLNGSQTVFGELVEGEAVLAELEKHVDRHGNVAEGLTIEAAGRQ